MPLIDSGRGKVIRDFTIEQLIERANHMRGLNEIALCSAGSGHSGGTLGIMDICAALYLKIARHDPTVPDWAERDRIVWSAGHKAPALYTSLAVAGYFDERELMTLRMLGSPFQGHPHWRDCPGVEFSTGSLGQGFSLAVGVAMAAHLNDQQHRVFVICSDGEQQEGSIWEAAMAAAHYRLDNLILIVDKNRLQIDGAVDRVMTIDPLVEKYRAFNWEVIGVDGHDMQDIVTKLDQARNHNDSGRPVALICHTNKGRGVSFMENAVGWHGKTPNREELDRALEELGLTGKFPVDSLLEYGAAYQAKIDKSIAAKMPRFSRDYWWNSGQSMKVTMQPTRKGFGRALDKYGEDERIVCLGADISDSICISDFYKNHTERKDRFISIGVAEQNGTAVAAGLAREGKIPVFGTYGVFASARNLDQLRVSVCYGNLNVLIAGAHGGISVGPDGATHQELESIFQITGLPNMHMAAPCDIVETEKMTRALLFDVTGPKYLRFAREATPIITDENTPFEFGIGNVIRVRRENENLKDAIDITLASEYLKEGEKLSIISCGPETAEAVRAAYILKSEFSLETRVLHLHTLKPLDRSAIIRAARETGAIITVEEHQVGGLGNQIAGIIAQERDPATRSVPLAMIGVRDRFGESGRPWQLIRKFGLAAEHIALKARELLSL